MSNDKKDVKDKRSSFFTKAKETYKKNIESWNFAIGIFFSLLGVVVSILTVIYSPNDTVIAISVVGCQIIVVIMCIITFIVFFKNKEILDNAEKENERIRNEANKENERIRSEAKQKIDHSNKISEVNVQFSKKVLIFSKNINKRINNFLTLICDESDKYYVSVCNIKEKMEPKLDDDDFVNLCIQQMQEEKQKYKNSLFTLYKRYIKGVFEETLKAINCDLKSKDINLDVSISLKMFSTTYNASLDHKTMQVYTAFRDKETYDNKKEREIGERHFTVNKNCDFQKCLTKESYIKNNFTETTDDYWNENYPTCIQFYNCTAVVPIICDYKSDKQFYGFFCCDALNTEKNIDVFDKNTTDILYSAALTIGMFFDSINSAWMYMIDKEESDFLSYLHKQIFKG